MFKRSQTHPLLVVDSKANMTENWLMLDGKVCRQSIASDHESVCSTVPERFKHIRDTTHAWVCWHGLEEWQMKLAMDFLLNIVGYRGAWNSDGLSGPQPLARAGKWWLKEHRRQDCLGPSPSFLRVAGVCVLKEHHLQSCLGPWPSRWRAGRGAGRQVCGHSWWSSSSSVVPAVGGQACGLRSIRRVVDCSRLVIVANRTAVDGRRWCRSCRTLDTPPRVELQSVFVAQPLMWSGRVFNVGASLEPRRVVSVAPWADQVKEEDVHEDDQECDYVGLETRAAVGEEEEKTEDQARQPLAADDDSEVEQRAFKERVAAVTRMQPPKTLPRFPGQICASHWRRHHYQCAAAPTGSPSS